MKVIPRSSGVQVRHESYPVRDGVEIGCCIFSSSSRASSNKENSPALVVHWGGNAEVACQQVRPGSPWEEYITSGLVIAVFVDYRGYGWSGGEPSLPSLLSDAHDLFASLPSLLGESWPASGPLILMGRSIGALCAIHCAALHEEVSALILDSPCCCHWPLSSVPADRWSNVARHIPRLQPTSNRVLLCDASCGHRGKGQAEREAAWLDPCDKLIAFDGALLILSGTKDEMCPPKQVEVLYAASESSASPREVIWLEGKGHNDLPTSPVYWQGLGRFLHSVAHRESLAKPLEENLSKYEL